MSDCDAILLKDVFSSFHKNKKEPRQYGKRGEKVKLIDDRGSVCIVKSKTRIFPVHISKLKIIPNGSI